MSLTIFISRLPAIVEICSNISGIMKNITWVLIIIQLLYICDVSCHDILSKFHQHTYKIRDFRAELMSYNSKIFHFYELKTFKYNRTTPAVNATLRFKIAVKDKLEVVVQALKFMSNEYRHFPLRSQLNIQKCYEADVMGLQRSKQCGNLTTCYFEKDVTYEVCNFILDETKFPPLIPNGRYKLDMNVTYLEEEAAFLCFYIEIYTPIPYPKK